ncbi:MAG: UDP-3-O-(3-hydroxymyristoyl)glucosamine N-acyltransferase [Capnocytophaga sp.]|nr:UDP-3-O-(3-hydroxymyristoyl)glucosamine N-acyltransferase [Capnocytophaga sp.]
MNKISAIQIAEALAGELIGNPEVEVFKLSKIEEGTEGAVTFLANPKYKHFIYTTNASVVIVANDFVPEQEIKATLIKVQDPYSAFTQILEFYNQMRIQSKLGIENPTYIAGNVELGENIYIGAFTSISANCKIGNNVKIYSNVNIGDNVVIADNCVIFSGVTICSDSVIGQNCILHSGVVIGADGFGFAPQETGDYKKIPQIGNVIIEDNVEIGANATIDRATLGSTIIRKGVKIDNLVQIAHNVEVGRNTVIASQAGIAGSTKIGANCVIGGQVGIAGHLSIGNEVKIQAQSGINRNIKDKEVIQGTPAISYRNFNKSYVVFKKLPELLRKIEELDKKIKNKI